MPRTVRHDQLPAAVVAVVARACRSALLVGPAIGGLLVGTVGVGWCLRRRRRRAGHGHRCCSPLLRAYPPDGPQHPAEPRGHRARASSYAVGRKDLLGTYLVDIVAMFLAMPIVLFPALAAGRLRRSRGARPALHRRDASARLLATADVSGWTARVHHHGRAIVVAVEVLGRRDRARRPGADDLGGAGLPRAGRRRRHDQRHLPRHHLEPDHPRRACAAGWPASRCCPTRSARSAARSGRAWSPTACGVRASIVSGGLLCVVGVAADRRCGCATSGATTTAPTSTPCGSAACGPSAPRPSRPPPSRPPPRRRSLSPSRPAADQSLRKPPRNRRKTPPSRGSGAAGGGACRRWVATGLS